MCYGTLPKVCSEPLSTEVSGLPLQVEEEHLSPASDCVAHVLLGQGGCIFGHSKGGLMMSCAWTSTGRTGDEASVAPLAPHTPFAPWSHVGQNRHLSTVVLEGSKTLLSGKEGVKSYSGKCVSFSSGQTRTSLVVFGRLSKTQA